ncbi:MAG: phosphoribosylglycinamide formyltransferase [Methanomassiliicoccales archaeon]|nr:phosphoribosylglycinamide formyltransferase [Methanomassiliicoccales archaeon]NYT14382.1 phosphoribosylglycinamide formyltransferase [Methanomassiliicoccales archaeon]
MLRIGWFSTGRDEAARELLKTVTKRKEEGFFEISIEFVFSNWEEGEEPEQKDFKEREEFFELIHAYGIPIVTLSWKKFEPALKKEDKERWRIEYGREMRKLLSSHPFDLGILAGYMLWVDDESCQEFDLINLHPALPGGPKGTWQEVIWQLIEQKAEKQGAMIHLTTPEWDEGPALTYCSFSLRTDEYLPLWEQMENKLRTRSLKDIISEEGETEPLFKRIRTDGEMRELPLLAQSIKLFADGKVFIRDQRLYVEGVHLDEAYDLTKEVDEEISR